MLAQELLTDPLMFNHHRGLWGYTGTAADGEPMTVQATGMGGPSAAIVLEELADLGLKTAIRVGTCGALVDDFALGDLLVVEAALAEDGTSQALGASGLVAANDAVTAALSEAVSPAGRRGVAVSSDLFYDPDPSRAVRWIAAGALAVEMEAAAVLRVGERRGLRAGCLLAVTDLLAGAQRERISAEDLQAAGASAGRAGAAALTALAAV